MWESPIYVYTEDDITRKITKELEGYIITETKKVVPYINKEELLKALEYDRNQYEKGWDDRDNEIVRCKDCVYFDAEEKVCVDMMTADEDGYCSWGERKDEVTE